LIRCQADATIARAVSPSRVRYSLRHLMTFIALAAVLPRADHPISRNEPVDSKDFDEFVAVRAAVHEGLRNGAFIDRTGWSCCRIVILPSFENCVAWDARVIRKRRRPPEHRLYRSCWRMDTDTQNLLSPLERLKHPRPYRPTVEVRATAIDGARIDELVQRFCGLPIPLGVAAPPIGCDGTSYELQLGHFFCHARIGWWNSLPAEWKAIEPLVDELISLFEFSWRGE
jgi:hypothetical protein